VLCPSSLSNELPSLRHAHEPPRLLRLFSSLSSSSTSVPNLDAPSPLAAAAASSIRVRPSQADAYDTTAATFTYSTSHSDSNPYRLSTYPLKHPDLLPPDLASRKDPDPTLQLLHLLHQLRGQPQVAARNRAQSNRPIPIVHPDRKCNSTGRVSLVTNTEKPTTKHPKVGRPGANVVLFPCRRPSR
jgi:hypothetical protein